MQTVTEASLDGMLLLYLMEETKSSYYSHKPVNSNPTPHETVTQQSHYKKQVFPLWLRLKDYHQPEEKYKKGTCGTLTTWFS